MLSIQAQLRETYLLVLKCPYDKDKLLGNICPLKDVSKMLKNNVCVLLCRACVTVSRDL